jgi:hypothetical protein
MSIRNDSYMAWMHVYLIWSSKEMHMNSEMCGLSNTKHLRRNTVLHLDDDFACLLPNNNNLMKWQACYLRT